MPWSVACDINGLAGIVFSGLSSLVIEDVADQDGVIVVRASTAAGPVPCPRCGAGTGRVHGYCERTVADVPADGRPVVVRVRVRRMRCPVAGCPVQTFREQVPGVLDRDDIAIAITPVWAEVESRIALEGTYPPSWFSLLVIAGLIGAVGILTNSQILIVGAMVVGPEYGAILSLAFGVTRRDSSRILRSAAALAAGFTLAIAGALLLALIIRGAGLEPKAYALGVRRSPT